MRGLLTNRSFEPRCLHTVLSLPVIIQGLPSDGRRTLIEKTYRAARLQELFISSSDLNFGGIQMAS
jgi:hypothetical protein